MTPDLLTNIATRLAKATPGPWIGVAQCTRRYVIQTGERIICYMNESGSPNNIQMKNGFLIASAPTDVAYLLARLKAAEEVVEKAKTIVQQFIALKAEQYEKLILHQTLESASENWNQLNQSIDFNPLINSLITWQQAKEKG